MLKWFRFPYEVIEAIKRRSVYAREKEFDDAVMENLYTTVYSTTPKSETVKGGFAVSEELKMPCFTVYTARWSR